MPEQKPQTMFRFFASPPATLDLQYNEEDISQSVFSLTELSDAQLAAGVALAEVKTNEVHVFTVPDDAVIHIPWIKRGAAEDVFPLVFTNWCFRFGTNFYDKIYVSSSGTISFNQPMSSAKHESDEINYLSPFHASLGAVPEGNRDLLLTEDSGFWHSVSPSNTARGTWSENIYNENEQVVARLYSGETPTAYFERNELGLLLAESNTVAATVCKNTMTGVATNEVVTIGTETTVITRGCDTCAHQTSLAVSGGPTVAIGYNEESEISSVSAEGWTALYRFAADGYDAGVELTTSGGVQLNRLVERDDYRRSLVSSVTNRIGDAVFQFLVYSYDGEGRVTGRNSDAFLYNMRNEVTSATIENKAYLYAYDGIGNFISNSRDGATTSFIANQLNQYASINQTNGTLALTYDADGNLTFDGVRTYAWDDANRLATVSLGDEVILQNEYDTRSRRVRKVTPETTHTFVYDGWNLVKETIVFTNGATEVVHYVWGKDFSGTMQGAGGVGGLLAVKRNGAWYHPFYDNNGNVTAYVDSQGNVVASYSYDAFGNTITQSGAMADIFSHRFSTKYLDAGTGHYYYGYRFYSPVLSRWLNRDPIAEEGGVNLYAFCENRIGFFDSLGQKRWVMILLSEGRRNNF